MILVQKKLHTREADTAEYYPSTTDVITETLARYIFSLFNPFYKERVQKIGWTIQLTLAVV